MTTALNDALDALIKLQTMDSELDHLSASSAELAKQVQAKKTALEAKKKALALSQEKAKQIAVARKQKDLELAEKEAAIKKHQAELNAVKSNDAFKALMHEIDALKKDVSGIEDGILQLMEESEGVAKAEKQEAVQAKALEAETAGEVAELEAKRKGVESDKAAREAARGESAARLAPETLSKYESIRQRRKGLAVVAAVADACSGCHMKLPPQTVVDLHKTSRLETCPNCTRILYIPAIPAAPAPPAA